jgi:electron transport complex protein RnfB
MAEEAQDHPPQSPLCRGGEGEEEARTTRRSVLRAGLRGACLLGLGGVAVLPALRRRAHGTVWQIDPAKCTRCGNCATYCRVKPSAVKCVHSHGLCGYCLRCFGYFDPRTKTFNAAAENQMCPTGAIRRELVEPPYYEYKIDASLCIGCGKCVEGCRLFGNGSLFLQVVHDRCLNCNECSIAAACPADAFVRAPAAKPYLLKKTEPE